MSFLLFNPRYQKALLSEVDSAMRAAAVATTEDIDAQARKLNARPLVRWFVVRRVTEEIEAAGYSVPRNQSEWEEFFKSLAEFLIAIAPIIFELIEAFI